MSGPFFGLVVNSALYLLMVFVAALVLGNRTAMYLSIVTAGICYLAYAAEMVPASQFTLRLLMALSIAAGACAGLALLFGIGK